MRKIVFLQHKCSRSNQDRVLEGERIFKASDASRRSARRRSEEGRRCRAGAMSGSAFLSRYAGRHSVCSGRYRVRISRSRAGSNPKIRASRDARDAMYRTAFSSSLFPPTGRQQGPRDPIHLWQPAFVQQENVNWSVSVLPCEWTPCKRVVAPVDRLSLAILHR